MLLVIYKRFYEKKKNIRDATKRKYELVINK